TTLRLLDRPARAERTAHADHRPRAGGTQRPGDGADGADGLNWGRAADRNRHLADAEGVEHRELARGDVELVAAHWRERQRPRVVGLARLPLDAEGARRHHAVGVS